jgi:ankyrin repeat protein
MISRHYQKVASEWQNRMGVDCHRIFLYFVPMYLFRTLSIIILPMLYASFSIAQTELIYIFQLDNEEDEYSFSEVSLSDSDDEEELIVDEPALPLPRFEDPPRPHRRGRDEANNNNKEESETDWSAEEDVVPNGRPVKKQVLSGVTTPLMIAAQNNDVTQINRLATQPGFDVDQVNEYGATALHAAAGANALAAVIRLLELGANRHARNENEETALDKARVGEFEAIIDALSE